MAEPAGPMAGEQDWRLARDGEVLRGLRRTGTGSRTGLFIHGFRSHCDGEKSRALSEMAGRHGFGWLRFDQRGCGGSDGQFRRFTVSGAIDDLHRVIAALGEPPCILVGSSLGGLIAIHAAASGRHRIEGLVLVAPALRFMDHFIGEQLRPAEVARWQSRGYRWFPDLYSGGCYRLDYGFCADALRYGPPPGRLPCPVRVIHGTRDELLPWRESRDWLDALECPPAFGGKGLEIIEGGDHRLSGWTESIARQTETLWNEVSNTCA
ncbi:MAG: alpha/beta hydrolase [Arenicellales bacterium]